MKLCRINSANIHLYKMFLPKEYQNVKSRRFLALGCFDERGSLGAAVIENFDGIMNIDSVFYDESLLEAGELEKLVTEYIIELKDKLEVELIEYVIEGTNDFLEDYDYTMMDIGFTPRRGEVECYVSTLGDVLEYQKDNLDKIIRKIKPSTFVAAKDLNSRQLDYYNELHYENPYAPEAQNSDISMFYLIKDYPAAGVFGNINEKGDIVFSWMGYEENVTPYMRLMLIYSMILNGADMFDKSTRIVVCPFSEEVKALISQFGFRKETDIMREARVYSYYL